MEPEAAEVAGGIVGVLLVSFVGLAIGALAKLLVPGRDPGGWLVTILLGIAGAWVGAFIANQLGVAPGLGAAIFLSTVGAILLLLVYRLFVKRG